MPYYPTSDSPVIRTTELVVWGVTTRNFHCREVGTGRSVTLRAYVSQAVPGTVITVNVTKEKVLKKGLSIDGMIQESRIDIPALGLVRLGLNHVETDDPAKGLSPWEGIGFFDPDEKEFDDRDLEEWEVEEGDLFDSEDEALTSPDDLEFPYNEIWMAGARMAYEMEQVLPGDDPDDDFDPVADAAEMMEAGQWVDAWRLLHGLLAKDLRCLDAYSHLGSYFFDGPSGADQAARYYEVGVAIGDWSLSPVWTGDFPDRRSYLLPWGWLDNRPYLRCLHGLALCRWRQGRFDDAARLMTDILWLNPPDNQGARLVLPEILSKTPWRPDALRLPP
ncbi:MAG: hypothetical protein ACYDBP_12990 [Leptospirales bacterium]